MSWNQALVDGPIDIYKDEALVPGYHLNVARGHVPEEALPFEIFPAEPVRVFAGGNTAFLKFADEVEAIAMLGDLWHEPPT